MLIPIIVLLVSVFFISIFIGNVLNVFIELPCFWGRVAFRSPQKIEYKFTIPYWNILLGIFGFAGLLWSVIKLAMIP